MKRVFFVFLAAVCLAFLWVSGVRADTVTATSTPANAVVDTCNVTVGDLAAVRAIQDNISLSYLDEIQQELAARRNLLSKTIACAEADAEQAKTDLDAVAVDPSLDNLKSQWSDRLSGAISYYNLQLQKVSEVGISGTESIAKEILTWRQDNYAPLALNVSNFVEWSTNQALFTTTEGRLAQIDNLANSPLFSESPDVQNDYEEAAASFKTAEDQNTSAENAFSQSLPPEQSFIFIKESLDSLSSTYQHFFDISNLIQSLLPH